jgi:hypothetical protein
VPPSPRAGPAPAWDGLSRFMHTNCPKRGFLLVTPRPCHAGAQEKK